MLALTARDVVHDLVSDQKGEVCDFLKTDSHESG